MSDPGQPRYPWWEFFFPGLFLLLGSVYVWWYLTELERTTGVQQLPAAAALLYEWGGKWAVVLLVAGIGALFSSIGAWKLIRKLRARRNGNPPP
jgi:hypothetical protein